MVFSVDLTPEPRDPDAPLVPRDAAPLRRVRIVAHLMDDAFRVPVLGVRFGLDPLVGFLPVVGSVAGSVVSLYVILEAAMAGVPGPTLARMAALVAVEAVVGSVPVVGPVFDAAWKANVWNVQTLEHHLVTREGSGAAAGT
jgi:hypothetical protein